MLFNSFEFAVFLPMAFLCYWFVFHWRLRLQNLFLLGISYLFYGWWDWRFLSLIAFSSLVDYLCGLVIGKEKAPAKRKLFLWVSMGVNLGLLGVFKYFNFFAASFAEAFSGIGYAMNPLTLDVVLPVGISFYTFQTMSYTLDVYKGKLKPTKDLIAFFAYVSFFPQLVAGPIERATNLLPQFYRKRVFVYERGAEGSRLILWGLFKKIVVADNCAVMVNEIFAKHEELSSVTLLMGMVYFAFQIYGDFSGYSDIAIGTAKLFGFDLMTNFRVPYFSRNIGEFWRRWHISFSTWFRDYLYIPLGGSRAGKAKALRNIFIIFLVSGFWHGANWTFLVWGGLNALYFVPSFLRKKNRAYLDTVAEGKHWPSIKELFQMGMTFLLTAVAWVFFRAETLGQAAGYLKRLVTSARLFPAGFYYFHPKYAVILTFFVLMEWFIFRHEDFQLKIARRHFVFRYVGYITVLALGMMFFTLNGGDFIYFQF
ncbi:MAG: MBOAT family protein [Cytophagales bacterium]|nr:MBOAT family protein [Cytophagales bacterium]